MLEKLKNEPVRIYAVVTAVLALVAHYVPDLPVALWAGVAAAILGVGEVVRSKVTPNGRVIVHEADLFNFGEAVLVSYDPEDDDDDDDDDDDSIEYGNEDTAWRAG